MLGSDAKNIKLVDGLGGLDDAVAKAAQLAKVKDYHTDEYPLPASWMDQLLNNVETGSGNYLDEQLRLTLGDMYHHSCGCATSTSTSPYRLRCPTYSTSDNNRPYIIRFRHLL